MFSFDFRKTSAWDYQRRLLRPWPTSPLRCMWAAITVVPGHRSIRCGPGLRHVGHDYGETKNAAHITTESRPTSHRNQWLTSNGITGLHRPEYAVVIAVSNPDLKLFPGMTANARILTAKISDTFKVPNAVLRIHPSAAVLKQFGLSAAPAGKQQVYVLQNGKLKAVPAEFGISDGQYTAVSSTGLNAGDQIVQRFSSASTATAESAPSSSPGSSTGRTPRL